MKPHLMLGGNDHSSAMELVETIIGMAFSNPSLNGLGAVDPVTAGLQAVSSISNLAAQLSVNKAQASLTTAMEGTQLRAEITDSSDKTAKIFAAIKNAGNTITGLNILTEVNDLEYQQGELQKADDKVIQAIAEWEDRKNWGWSKNKWANTKGDTVDQYYAKINDNQILRTDIMTKINIDCNKVIQKIKDFTAKAGIKLPTAANQIPDTNNYQTDTPATITTGTKLAMAGVGLAAVGIGGFLIVKRMNNNHSSRKDKSPVKHKHSKLQGLGKIHWN